MHRRPVSTTHVLAGCALPLLLLLAPVRSWASHTPDPTRVTIAGSLQEELGCPGDWQPDCAETDLTYDATDTVWQAVFAIPAGNWEYKAALDGTWNENYGANATQDGANIPLDLAADADVKFYYSHATHWITDNMSSVIAVAPGSFQSELGCAGDWDPSCLRSWLQDPDGDGIYSFSASLPAGDYEAKVAIDESWNENYGAGGVQNGPNIPFTVPPGDAEMLFELDWATKILTISLAPPPAQPDSVTIAGSLQEELGCPGDWQPDCAETDLTYDATDTVWQAVFAIPAGNWEYKAALDGTWNENYGANATQDGANIPLDLATDADVKFYYSHATHWITDNMSSVIAVAPGSFQSELGCAGDWDPSCLRSWLQDPDGDGIYSFSASLPAGDYEAKVAIDESWNENYGAGGVQNGPNIPFTLSESCLEILFTYDPVTHILTITCDGTGPVNSPPVAQCTDVTVSTSPQGLCSADANIDAGSYDPDGDPVTLDQNPPGPYSLGDNEVTLTITDDSDESDSCSGIVTVVDGEAPFIECNSPATIAPPDVPISFSATATDNCGVDSVSISGYDCYWYNPTGKRVDKTGGCALSVADDTVTIHETGGVKAMIEWGVIATDANGNSIARTCAVQVVKPSRP